MITQDTPVYFCTRHYHLKKIAFCFARNWTEAGQADSFIICFVRQNDCDGDAASLKYHAQFWQDMVDCS